MPSITAREFNQDVSKAKRAAVSGPVIITDRGEPSFVLLSISEYRRLRAPGGSLVDRLRADDDIEFEPGRFEFDVQDVEL